MPRTNVETDPIFSNPLLASIYDAFEGERCDLAPYLDIIKELHAKDIVDLGCGTGSLSLLLAQEDMRVIGVDPAEASIAVAQSKRGSENVEWIIGDATAIPLKIADAVVMIGNAAQAIIGQEQWDATLKGVHSALRSGGHFVFETRRPEAKAWQQWNKKASFQSIAIPNIGVVDGWVELTEVKLPLVSFQWSYFFHKSGETLKSASTLRFRSLSELERDLSRHKFKILEVRQAPDRPGQEYVVIARAP
jgi:SAM-dependent methyltransferase